MDGYFQSVTMRYGKWKSQFEVDHEFSMDNPSKEKEVEE